MVTDCGDRRSEMVVGEIPPVRQHMERCVRQKALRCSNELDEALPKQRGFATREADFLCAAVDQRQGFKDLVDDPTILDRSGRLRTHQTIIVAALRQKEMIVS